MIFDEETVLARLADHGIKLGALGAAPYVAGANALAAQVAVVRDAVPTHVELDPAFRTPFTEEL